MMIQPSRGEIWLINLDPTKGHEQAGTRPGLVISTDYFNSGTADLVVIVPLTTTQTGIPLHIEVSPPEGGLKRKSFIKCENVRSVSKDRFIEKWGSVSGATMLKVEERLRLLLEL